MSDLVPLQQRLADASAAVLDAVSAAALDESVTGGTAGSNSAAFMILTERLSHEQLLGLAQQVNALQSVADGFKVAISGEFAVRSAPELGAESLARSAGHANVSGLVAEVFDSNASESARLVRVADATAERIGPSGEVQPARCPGVQAALERGELSLEAANIIAGTLDATRGHADPEVLRESERVLLGVAGEAPLGELRKCGERVKALASAELGELTDRERRAKRMLLIRELKNGLTRIEWELPPEDAALVVPAIEAVCRQANFATGRNGFDGLDQDDDEHNEHAVFQFEPPITDRNGEALEPGAGPLHFDINGLPSSELAKRFARARSDAAVEIFRHSARCHCDGRQGVPTVTAVVRINYQDLIDQLGELAEQHAANLAGASHAGIGRAGANQPGAIAELDGVNVPISAGTARQLAAAANIIPAVLGGDSLPLDLGSGKRMFSRSQRLALIERDGGCAAPGCNASPAWCDVHHLEPWSRGGPTDIDNGVVLCSAHHHRVHENGWRIRVEPENPDDPSSPNVPWFYPPEHWRKIDPKRRHRVRGGRRSVLVAA